MIDFILLAKAIGIGLAIAMPVGPMSLMGIQRTLAGGRGAGLAFGAGVAAADATYAAVAAFGLTAVSGPLVAAGRWVQIVGSLVLLALAVRIATARPELTPAKAAGGQGRAFLTAYGLTLANPPTIVYFASVFASLGALGSLALAVQFTAGVGLGTMLWWLLLTAIVVRAAHALTPPLMRSINLLSGVGLALFALWGLWRGVAG